MLKIEILFALSECRIIEKSYLPCSGRVLPHENVCQDPEILIKCNLLFYYLFLLFLSLSSSQYLS